MKTIYLAGGCFWGMEKVLKIVPGVRNTTVGYANGHTEAPTYEQVKTDTTGYKETVKTEYDETKVSLEQLLDIYFLCIDPTVYDRQGHDIGTQYQTGVYYDNEEDGEIVRRDFEERKKAYHIFAVQAEELKNFWDAEEYHQDYLDKNPAGYCHITNAEMNAVRKYIAEQKL